MHFIDTATLQPAGTPVSARIKVGTGAGGMAFSEDGKKAFVSNSSIGAVSVIDLQAMQVIATHTTGNRPGGMTRLN